MTKDVSSIFSTTSNKDLPFSVIGLGLAALAALVGVMIAVAPLPNPVPYASDIFEPLQDEEACRPLLAAANAGLRAIEHEYPDVALRDMEMPDFSLDPGKCLEARVKSVKVSITLLQQRLDGAGRAYFHHLFSSEPTPQALLSSASTSDRWRVRWLNIRCNTAARGLESWNARYAMTEAASHYVLTEAVKHGDGPALEKAIIAHKTAPHRNPAWERRRQDCIQDYFAIAQRILATGPASSDRNIHQEAIDKILIIISEIAGVNDAIAEVYRSLLDLKVLPQDCDGKALRIAHPAQGILYADIFQAAAVSPSWVQDDAAAALGARDDIAAVQYAYYLKFLHNRAGAKEAAWIRDRLNAQQRKVVETAWIDANFTPAFPSLTENTADDACAA